MCLYCENSRKTRFGTGSTDGCRLIELVTSPHPDATPCSNFVLPLQKRRAEQEGPLSVLFHVDACVGDLVLQLLLENCAYQQSLLVANPAASNPLLQPLRALNLMVQHTKTDELRIRADSVAHGS
jgi:hypothetical protein